MEVFDSATDGRARFSLHAAFQAPRSKGNKTGRRRPTQPPKKMVLTSPQKKIVGNLLGYFFFHQKSQISILLHPIWLLHHFSNWVSVWVDDLGKACYVHHSSFHHKSIFPVEINNFRHPIPLKLKFGMTGHRSAHLSNTWDPWDPWDWYIYLPASSKWLFDSPNRGHVFSPEKVRAMGRNEVTTWRTWCNGLKVYGFHVGKYSSPMEHQSLPTSSKSPFDT